VGGPGDGLHPNRAGYLAMASAIDLDLLLPGRR
jgi:lysophospholipase L1-like esterase